MAAFKKKRKGRKVAVRHFAGLKGAELGRAIGAAHAWNAHQTIKIQIMMEDNKKKKEVCYSHKKGEKSQSRKKEEGGVSHLVGVGRKEKQRKKRLGVAEKEKKKSQQVKKKGKGRRTLWRFPCEKV